MAVAKQKMSGRSDNTMEPSTLKDLENALRVNEQYYTEIYHSSSKVVKANTTLTNLNRSQADIFSNYRHVLTQTDRASTVGECLGKLSEFQHTMENCRADMCKVIEDQFVNGMRQFVKEDLTAAKNQKKKYNKVRVKFESAHNNLDHEQTREKVNLQKLEKAKADMATAKAEFEEVTGETMDLLTDTNQATNFLSLENFLLYLEAQHIFFKKVCKWLESAQPAMAKLRAHLDEDREAFEKFKDDRACGLTLNASDKTVFEVPLAALCGREGKTVPTFVSNAVEYIRANGLKAEGVFRISAMAHDIQTYKESINKGIDIDFESLNDIHLATGLLKQFLRDLPEPLCTVSRYSSLMEAFQSDLDNEKKNAKLREIFEDLPRCNYDVFKVLLELSIDTQRFEAQNKMTFQNLATVIAPNVLHNDDPMTMVTDIADVNKLYVHLLKNFADIFVVDRLSILQLAIEDNLEDMQAALDSGKVKDSELGEQDEAGRTALHWAVIHANKDMISALAAAGADLDAANGDGDTAAHQALATEKIPIAAHLVGLGASVELKDSSEKTVLEKAAGLSRDCFQLLSDANAKYKSATVGGVAKGQITRTFSDGKLRREGRGPSLIGHRSARAQTSLPPLPEDKKKAPSAEASETSTQAERAAKPKDDSIAATTVATASEKTSSPSPAPTPAAASTAAASTAPSTSSASSASTSTASSLSAATRTVNASASSSDEEKEDANEDGVVSFPTTVYEMTNIDDLLESASLLLQATTATQWGPDELNQLNTALISVAQGLRNLLTAPGQDVRTFSDKFFDETKLMLRRGASKLQTDTKTLIGTIRAVNHAEEGEERTKAASNMLSASQDFLAGLAAYYQGCEAASVDQITQSTQTLGNFITQLLCLCKEETSDPEKLKVLEKQGGEEATRLKHLLMLKGLEYEDETIANKLADSSESIQIALRSLCNQTVDIILLPKAERSLTSLTLMAKTVLSQFHQVIKLVNSPQPEEDQDPVDTALLDASLERTLTTLHDAHQTAAKKSDPISALVVEHATTLQAALQVFVTGRESGAPPPSTIKALTRFVSQSFDFGSELISQLTSKPLEDPSAQSTALSLAIALGHQVRLAKLCVSVRAIQLLRKDEATSLGLDTPLLGYSSVLRHIANLTKKLATL